MKLVKQAYAEIKKLITENVMEYREKMITVVKTEMRLQRETTELKESWGVIGKLIYAFRMDFLEAEKSRPEYAGKSLADALHTFLGIPKGKNVLNRGYSCANAFRCVVKGLIPEETYDAVTDDALVALSEVITKVNDNLDHPAVADACKVLNGPGEKKAKEIRNSVKARLSTKGEDENEEVVYLTPEQAAQAEAQTKVLNAIAEIGSVPTSTLLAELNARARASKDENELREIAQAVHLDLPEALNANPLSTEDKVDSWIAPVAKTETVTA